MDDNDHEIIANLREYVTDPNATSLDAIATEFAVLPDQTRVHTLQKMKGWLSEESATRKAAQLLDLTRKMERVHVQCRRSGR